MAHHTYRTNLTHIFIDWDDTLFPSTDLARLGYKVTTSKPAPDSLLGKQLANLEAVVSQLLIQCIAYGTVVIVTNSEHGWVQKSAKHFMPSLVPLLDELTVMSARSLFERDRPFAYETWKYLAFKSALEKAALPQMNILSLGDNAVEHKAAQRLGTDESLRWIKTVKYHARPTIEILRMENEVMCQQMYALTMASTSSANYLKVNFAPPSPTDIDTDDEELIAASPAVLQRTNDIRHTTDLPLPLP
ncbi:Hypothetical protein POVN_LOCUS671 [uncultured virus]|nr:Hypothetical protein POVN_LOCUS671 [uncultured virus]